MPGPAAAHLQSSLRRLSRTVPQTLLLFGEHATLTVDSDVVNKSNVTIGDDDQFAGKSSGKAASRYAVKLPRRESTAARFAITATPITVPSSTANHPSRLVDTACGCADSQPFRA